MQRQRGVRGGWAKVDAANILAGRKLIAHVTHDGIGGAYPCALMLPQSKTERLLVAHLACLGVNVEHEVKVVGFTDTGGEVTTALRDPDGRKESVQTERLAGCDGAHSTVRHILGLPFLGETQHTDWILADIHLEGESLCA
jgi:2-polyprenyl-6-methoxyphenol hydroxylase-like FAD-dependent oxidoreductase